jgi:hypothetical protein
MIGRKLGILGSSFLVAAIFAGCSAGVGTDQEKTGVVASALIEKDPTSPYAFPEPVLLPVKDTYTCEGRLHLAGGTTDPAVPGIWASNAECGSDDGDRHGCQNYVAMPVQNTVDKNGVTDPYATPYTHGYSFGATNCVAGDLSCQLESDFFSIPKAHGFKYDIKRVLNNSIRCENIDGRQRCTATTTAHEWYLEGIQRVDQSWWYKPWRFQSGVSAPWLALTTGAMADANAHPPYGVDEKSEDWASLWNLAYTYSATGPNAAKTANIESEHHQCAVVYVLNAQGGLVLYDFHTAVETHDPINNPW